MAERQLGLFAGKRQRGVTVKDRTSEFALQCQVADALRDWCRPDWRYTAIPLGEHRTKATAARLKRGGVIAGWPDFMLLHCTGRMVWLELKRPAVKASPSHGAQEDLSAFIGDCHGHRYICTNNLRDALDLLRDAGVLRIRVSA